MKKLQLTGLLVAALLFAGGQIFGQDVVGKWRTIDDETPTDDTCDKCKGALKDKRIRGMVIISGLTRSDEVWKGKKGILDPGNGKFYDVKIWLEDSKTLTVRGSIGPIGRKQTWHRVIE